MRRFLYILAVLSLLSLSLWTGDRLAFKVTPDDCYDCGAVRGDVRRAVRNTRVFTRALCGHLARAPHVQQLPDSRGVGGVYGPTSSMPYEAGHVSRDAGCGRTRAPPRL